MPQSWNKDRSELAQIGAEICRRGYPPSDVAKSIAYQHYFGANRALAAAKLIPLIIKKWNTLNGCRTEDQEKNDQMATHLREEGWKPILDDLGRCIWQHQASGITVNPNGGLFRNFTEATITTFNSATRQMIMERSR